MPYEDLSDPLTAPEPVRRARLGTGEEVWLVTGYEQARAALTDSRLSKAPRDAGSYSAADRATNLHMLATDPPDHTRLRRLVTAAFTMRRIEALRPRIEGIADELIDEMAGQREVDLISAYSFPLAIQVICELLGIPLDDRDTFRAWTAELVAGADVTGEIIAKDLQETLAELVAYLGKLVELHRDRPGDDVLSGLIAVRDHGDRLTGDELTSMAFLLLLAGHETTMSLIGNGTATLVTEGRWAQLRADRSLLPAAIEELLRAASSVDLSTGRIATTDVELGGRRIRAGDVVMVGLLDANRDPARFDDPGELRFDRPTNQHLAFGHGIHHCLGAPLARLEALVAFDKLLDRFPDLRLAVPYAELTLRPSSILRGFRTLPVHLGSDAGKTAG